ncbi:UNVERIFIED_ORG: hypothetical protein ABIB63_003735 [Xanthomonas axonopodis]
MQRASSSVTTASASAWRPCAASQRADSGKRLRSHQIASANAPLSNTTQRQPLTPSGADGTNIHAVSATVGTARNCTKNANANAALRMCRGTSSDRYVSMVTSSIPNPIPTTKRSTITPLAVLCRPIATVAAVYQIKAKVNTGRRPNRSANGLNSAAPTNNPRKVAAANAA